MSDYVAFFITNILFGMRLRVKGEFQEENAVCLINILHKITNVSEALCITFYCDYSKMTFVGSVPKNKYEGITISNTIGSTRPFIPLEESETYILSLEKQNLTDAEIRLRNDVHENWVVEEDDMMGAEIRITNCIIENCPRVSAYLLNDMFDRK